MENMPCKIAVSLILLFAYGCHFDGEYPIKVVSKIADNYYVAKDLSAPEYGYIIVYSTDSLTGGSSSEILSTLVKSAFLYKDTLIISTYTYFESLKFNYYIIPVNRESAKKIPSSLIRIDKSLFENKSARFRQVNLQ
jgi:hypothetical protein